MSNNINAYSMLSNYTKYSMSASLFSNFSRNNTEKYNTSSSASSSDLYNLMKEVDNVRASAKSLTEKYEKNLKGESDSDIGTVASEKNLSKAADTLFSAADRLSSAKADGSDDYIAKVQDFVDSYNGVVDSLKKSGSVDALRAGLQMTKNTSTYAASLSWTGIKVGTDNKLTLDTDKLKKADMNVVGSALSGFGAVTKAADKAKTISKAAANKANIVQLQESTNAMNEKRAGTYNKLSQMISFSDAFVGSLFNSRF